MSRPRTPTEPSTSSPDSQTSRKHQLRHRSPRGQRGRPRAVPAAPPPPHDASAASQRNAGRTRARGRNTAPQQDAWETFAKYKRPVAGAAVLLLLVLIMCVPRPLRAHSGWSCILFAELTLRSLLQLGTSNRISHRRLFRLRGGCTRSRTSRVARAQAPYPVLSAGALGTYTHTFLPGASTRGRTSSGPEGLRSGKPERKDPARGARLGGPARARRRVAASAARTCARQGCSRRIRSGSRGDGSRAGRGGGRRSAGEGTDAGGAVRRVGRPRYLGARAERGARGGDAGDRGPLRVVP